jgi:hypothetical protein
MVFKGDLRVAPSKVIAIGNTKIQKVFKNTGVELKPEKSDCTGNRS